MILKKYAAFFQPHELDALTAACVAVWQQVRATEHLRTGEASALKNNLAQIILASACTAEREHGTPQANRFARNVREATRNKRPEPAH